MAARDPLPGCCITKGHQQDRLQESKPKDRLRLVTGWSPSARKGWRFFCLRVEPAGMKENERNSRRLITVGTLALAMIVAGCKTLNPATGQKEYDPAKTSAVVSAVSVPASSAIRRALNRSPQHANEIAGYLRAAGGVFQEIAVTKEFDPIKVAAKLDEIVVIKNDTVIDLKNLGIALYTIFYSQRLRAELAPDSWMIHVADTFASAIDRGLKDAGMLGL